MKLLIPHSIQDLYRAFLLDQFVLYYQPQFNLITSKFEGVEALLRWRHPQKGLLLPLTFIPLVERSRLMLLLGEWVLIAACRQGRAWQESGMAPIRIAVNVAEAQFRQKDFPKTVERILKETGLDPAYLELELSENMRIDDKAIIHTIYALKRLGVQIALDDFGVGSSSMSHLKKLPLDRVKIDQTYIKGIHQKKIDQAIVEAVIYIAAKLKLQVMAEGVECSEELAHLLSSHCQEAQGYYFSHPRAKEEVEKFLRIYQNRQFLAYK